MARTLPVFLLAALAVVLVPVAGCGAEERGTISLALADAGLTNDTRWFRLRLYEGVPDSGFGGEIILDTQCRERQSDTYELNDIPTGAGRSVLFEGFDSNSCLAVSRTSLGFRGDLLVTDGPAAPYYHIPIYREQAVTALPEDLNISQSEAVLAPGGFCEDSEDCATVVEPPGACFADKSSGTAAYWCVPTCTEDADCAVFHERASCDVGSGWCMMRFPFPLNLSEPRAFGHAARLPDGGVAFLGGFGKLVEGRLVPVSRLGERLNPATGVFAKLELDGGELPAAGMSGFHAYDSGRMVLVGGLRRATVTWTGEGAAATLQIGQGLVGGDLSQDALVIDAMAGTATVTSLPRGIAGPAVVALPDTSLLVMGGLATAGPGSPVEVSDLLWHCTFKVTDGAAGVICQEMGHLDAPRFAPAAMCVDSAQCDQVLVVGGNEAGAATAELIDTSAFFSIPVGSPQLPATLYAPRLCGQRLVAGSAMADGVGGMKPVALGLAMPDVAVTSLTQDGGRDLPVWPAVAEMPDGDCWVGGGLDGDGQASRRLFRVTTDSIPPTTYDLTRPRFGAMAAVMTSGPLTGSVVYAGGLGLGAGGTTRLIRGAEVLRP